jgi:RNA polymerase sigma-70 factor (ECF subfamily)
MAQEQCDEELMLSYRAGDAAAFETLYRRHKGGLYRYILRQCGNKPAAEELFQDVWMNLISARGRYEVKAKFATYLYQMAHNRVVDHYRRQHTGNPGHPVAADVSVDMLPCREQDRPDRQVDLQHQAERLLALVGALPAVQREAFVLREEAGLSVAEIAAVTGVNVDTAKSRLRYAVNKLRNALSDVT